MTEDATSGAIGTTRGASGTSRSLLAVVAIVIGVVALAFVTVLVASRPPATYPADSPEGTMQRFMAAHADDDPGAAYAFFSRSVRAAMPIDSYRQAWVDYAWERAQDRRVVLERVDLRDTRATVHLRIDVYSGGGPFGSSRYSHERSVGLVREDGAWWIDEPLVGLEPVGYYR